jgi:subtilisin family serine protease
MPGIANPTPVPPTPTIPPTLPGAPSATSTEYVRNYGLGLIHASAAWAEGATGQGITVGVIDSGVNPNQADLLDAVSPLSTDIIAGRNTPVGTSNHATEIATIIAARHNDMGTVGVAFQVTILSVRADSTSSGNFADSNTAAGIDYAVANGARVINLSIGGSTPDNAALSAALQRAANAGVVIVASAGNDGLPDPEFPARGGLLGNPGGLLQPGRRPGVALSGRPRRRHRQYV